MVEDLMLADKLDTLSSALSGGKAFLTNVFKSKSSLVCVLLYFRYET